MCLKHKIYSIVIMTCTVAEHFDRDDINNYTYKDLDYYRIYNKKLNEERIGKDVVCDLCSCVVKQCHLKRHQSTHTFRRIASSKLETDLRSPL